MLPCVKACMFLVLYVFVLEWNGPGSYVLRKFGMVLLYRGNGPCVRDWMCWPMVPNGSGLCVCGIGSCGLGDGSRVCVAG